MGKDVYSIEVLVESLSGFELRGNALDSSLAADQVGFTYTHEDGKAGRNSAYCRSIPRVVEMADSLHDRWYVGRDESSHRQLAADGDEKSKRILVADDDPGIVDALRMMLELAGYEVMTTVDGTRVSELAQEPPDLILLDIWMSGRDGRDIARDLKCSPETESIPIVMISANRDTERFARECGADDFLLKPFDMDDLLDKVAYFMSLED